MTFIASVVAKDGVAVIADSLVTRLEKVLFETDFTNLLIEKVRPQLVAGVEVDKVQLDLNPYELNQLFVKKPGYTKDFQDKLFQFDSHTAITTAGSAYINNKEIADLISEIKGKVEGNSYDDFEEKLDDFCTHLNQHAIQHLKANSTIGKTNFIISRFDTGANKVELYKIWVGPASKELMDQNGGETRFSCVEFHKVPEFETVACDGQNRISERILFGHLDFYREVAPLIIKRVAEDYKITIKGDLIEYSKEMATGENPILSNVFFQDMKVAKLAGLSLQQAVNLASLLMNIEIQFQHYTENIPTVGGVIKLAVIDKNGFRYISGHEILPPRIY